MTGDPKLEEALRWLSARLPEVEAALAEPFCERIGGGISNTSYRVTAGDLDWVVRLRAENQVRHRLDIRREARLQETAAAADLAPRVIESDPERGILVTRYLAGATTWTPQLARRWDNIPRVAARLRTFHQLDAELEAYRPLAASQSYLQAAGASRGPEPGWSEELITLATTYERCYGPTVVCHNDLVAANILDDGELRFVDLEYAVSSDPILDLASLVAMNDFDGIQTNHLLDSYCESGRAYTARAFDDVVRMVRLLSYFWSLSRIREADDPSTLNRFAEEMAAMLR